MLARALKIVWLLYSALGLILLFVVLFIPPRLVLQNTPVCYSIKQFGKPCFMCGATRSFLQAGSANFTQALQYNKLAVVLFAALVLNTIIVTIYNINKLKTKKQI